MTELAKAEFAGVDADANTRLSGRQPKGAGKIVRPLAPVVLNFARGKQRFPGAQSG